MNWKQKKDCLNLAYDAINVDVMKKFKKVGRIVLEEKDSNGPG